MRLAWTWERAGAVSPIIQAKLQNHFGDPVPTEIQGSSFDGTGNR
jgi:hypothetical protein